jgi:hypothetical protein
MNATLEHGTGRDSVDCIVRPLLVCDDCGRLWEDNLEALDTICECGRMCCRMEWATTKELQRYDMPGSTWVSASSGMTVEIVAIKNGAVWWHSAASGFHGSQQTEEKIFRDAMRPFLLPNNAITEPHEK